ncbi:NAD(P)-binding domain-containing protein [Kitasatospora sp. NPDC093679]|uniref:NAD(P)-binding domain-containing protein n=1 Tax=Kitasatospora sp. NPDC093679 TaxID=3154983 RepID=UPI003412018E
MQGRGTVEPEAVVIGAGPYGLAAAAHLRGAGVSFRAFGEPMAGWREGMPAGMFLKSTPRASCISDPSGRYGFNDYRHRAGRGTVGDTYPIPLDEFVEYGEWFQRERVPELERTQVARVEGAPGGFRVTLEDGESVTARSVVVSTGLRPFAYLPPELAALAGSDLCSHTSEHADLRKFAGQRVAVVGAGQSALESAALLHEAGASPTVVVRGPRVIYGEPPDADVPSTRPLIARVTRPSSNLGPGWGMRAYADIPWLFRFLPDDARAVRVRKVLGPAGAWWLEERVDGLFPVLTGHPLAAAEAVDGTVRLSLEGPTELLEADHVLAATGYRANVARLAVLDEGLRRAIRTTAAGAPRLAPGLESSVPGLYFTGLAAADTFGPVMRFVCGTHFAAHRIGRHVAARSRAA